MEGIFQKASQLRSPLRSPLLSPLLENPKWQHKRRSFGRSLLPEAKRLSYLVLAFTVYIVLYSAFGSWHKHAKPHHKVQNFPRKIWQSWKVDATSFEARDAERARSWVIKNPSHRYEVLTDGNALAYVEEVFGPTGLNRLDIVHTYKSLNARIIQADLLRYIIMYAEGGIWADIDVEAIRPFDAFIPKRYNERDLDMIIGIETDEPDFKDHPRLGVKAQSFCQWTFVCKPRLPVMLHLIENILVWLDKLAEKQGKTISTIELDFDEVLAGTGPTAFTQAILAEMTKGHGRNVSWDYFHGIEESRVLGRVLVLPSEAFAAGTGHSNSGNHGGKGAMVKHHFHASTWTDTHPRNKHPIYGEVEKCNWDVECVRLYDANIAFFESLSTAEKAKMVALKTLDDDEELKSAYKAPAPLPVGIPPPMDLPPSDDLPQGPIQAGLTPGLVPLFTESDAPAEGAESV